MSAAPPVHAGTSGKSLWVGPSAGPIRLDGVLDEPAWLEAQAVSDFVQQEPEVGRPATERTEVRAVLSEAALYLGVVCFDSEPQRISARERRRDNALLDDDRFEVVIDTFHDHRNAFYFVTNPLGTRFDALITDEGIDINTEWDDRWWIGARIGEDGWRLEIEIPLSTLRAPRGLEVWGINFKRFIRRKNETAQWTSWDRDFSFVQVSQAGHLEGLEGVRTGLRLRMKPYLLGGLRETALSGGAPRNASAVGLEVAKLGLGPGLTAELTLNTDFAQAEVDQAVVNLTRFPFFFPERREFFLERAGIFEFGVGGRRGGEAQRTLQMFHPRRIGLTDDRRPVPVLGGAKVVGRLAGFDVGLLDVQTERFEGRPASNYSAFRLKRNVLARSNVGLFATNRQSGEPGDANRVLGADANFTFLKNLDVQAFLGRSFTPGLAGDSYVGRAKLNWLSDLYEVFAEHLYVGDDFRHDLGFVPRQGRRSDATFVWEPRPRALGLRNLVLRGELIYFTDTGGRLLTRQQVTQLGARFQSDDVLRFNTTHNLEQLEAPFPITSAVRIPVALYRFREYFVEYESSPRRMLGSRQRLGWGRFFGGERRYFTATPSFKPSPALSLEVSYEHNRVRLPQGSFSTHVVNGRLNLNLTSRLLTTALAQYETDSRRWVFFFRLRFIHHAGDDLYVVFNQTPGAGLPTGRDRSLIVKLTRSFDF